MDFDEMMLESCNLGSWTFRGSNVFQPFIFAWAFQLFQVSRRSTRGRADGEGPTCWLLEIPDVAGSEASLLHTIVASENHSENLKNTMSFCQSQ